MFCGRLDTEEMVLVIYRLMENTWKLKFLTLLYKMREGLGPCPRKSIPLVAADLCKNPSLSLYCFSSCSPLCLCQNKKRERGKILNICLIYSESVSSQFEMGGNWLLVVMVTESLILDKMLSQ